MATFTSGGVELAYDDITPAGGAERTIVLIHGFASNRNEGWKRTGWYHAFERRRMRVIALDQRGHGESAKLYEPQAYVREKLAGDALALLDHLGVGRCEVFGYSMGTRTALQASMDAPGRAYAIASATVPLNRYASCGTTPRRCRNSVRSYSRTSTPSTRTAPAVTS